MFWSYALAQTTTQTPARPSLLESILPFLIVFFIFYFLMIRPQSAQRKAHQKVLSELKRGDKVLTASGILGTIEGLTEKFVTLEIANNVRIKILRNQIAGLAKEGQE